MAQKEEALSRGEPAQRYCRARPPAVCLFRPHATQTMRAPRRCVPRKGVTPLPREMRRAVGVASYREHARPHRPDAARRFLLTPARLPSVLCLREGLEYTGQEAVKEEKCGPAIGVVGWGQCGRKGGGKAAGVKRRGIVQQGRLVYGGAAGEGMKVGAARMQENKRYVIPNIQQQCGSRWWEGTSHVRVRLMSHTTDTQPCHHQIWGGGWG